MPDELQDALDESLDVYDAETKLRAVLAWARAQAAENRESNPITGRAMALVATHTEDALRCLLLPVP